jgi:hypothetical protein
MAGGFFGPTAPDGWGLDNLQFDLISNTVPEPSSLALLGIGAGALALAGVRRRKRRNA